MERRTSTESTAEGSGQWAPLAAVAAASLCVALAAARTLGLRDFLNDDFYITYTFARSVAEGHGFSYNGGPPVLGTTTPLLALLLALGQRALPGVPPPDLAISLGAAAWVAGGWMLYRLLASAGASRFLSASTASLVLLWGAGGWTRFWLGGELPLFFSLLLAIVLLVSERRDAMTGALIALLFLTRGEGLLVLPLAAGYRVLVDRKAPGALVLGFALPFLLWCAYAWWAFGAPLPSTLKAKIAQGSSGIWHAFRDRWLSTLQHQVGTTMAVSPAWPWASTAVFALVGVARVARERRFWPLALMAVFAAGAVAGYLVLNVSWYAWYTLNFALATRVLAALGASWTVERLWARARASGGRRRAGLALACGAVAVFTLSPLYRSLGAVFFRQENLRDPRSEPYRALAAWLNANAAPGATVMHGEIGYLGYYTRLRMVDWGGLVTPGVTPWLRLPNLGERLLARDRPTFVVEWPEFRYITGDFVESDSFERGYEHVLDVATPLRDMDAVPVSLWRRREVTP